MGRDPRLGAAARTAPARSPAPRGHAVSSVEDALDGAGVVCVATPATEPVLRREWLAPGAHVNSVGFTDAGRELDPALVRDALVVVESRESALAPPPAGSTRPRGVRGRVELGELVAGRPRPHEPGAADALQVRRRRARGRRGGRPRLARRGGARARHRRRALKRQRLARAHPQQPPAARRRSSARDTNCARLNGPQMSSLRRMNSTRKRSIPASTAHQPISSPGPHAVAAPPQPDRQRAHDEELVDRASGAPSTVVGTVPFGYAIAHGRLEGMP